MKHPIWLPKIWKSMQIDRNCYNEPKIRRACWCPQCHPVVLYQGIDINVLVGILIHESAKQPKLISNLTHDILERRWWDFWRQQQHGTKKITANSFKTSGESMAPNRDLSPYIRYWGSRPSTLPCHPANARTNLSNLGTNLMPQFALHWSEGRLRAQWQCLVLPELTSAAEDVAVHAEPRHWAGAAHRLHDKMCCQKNLTLME